MRIIVFLDRNPPKPPEEREPDNEPGVNRWHFHGVIATHLSNDELAELWFEICGGRDRNHRKFGCYARELGRWRARDGELPDDLRKDILRWASYATGLVPDPSGKPKELSPQVRAMSLDARTIAAGALARLWNETGHNLRLCLVCRRDISHLRKDAKTCGRSCRVQAHRGRHLDPTPIVPRRS